MADIVGFVRLSFALLFCSGWSVVELVPNRVGLISIQSNDGQTNNGLHGFTTEKEKEGQ